MNHSYRQPNSAPPPCAVRRKALLVSQSEMVWMGSLSGCGKFPLLIEPKIKGLRLTAWAADQRMLIEDKVLEHGAILFRDFTVDGVSDFECCIEIISGGALEYRFRASPRSQVGKNIYTSTDYPADQSIFPHNEHSYSPIFPLRLLFFCETPAVFGGETPIGDNRRVFRNIDRLVVEHFRRKKIMYVRNYGDGFGLPWQTVFHTSDKREVEQYCKGVNIRVEWKPENRLRTVQVGPAVLRHPRTGETVWFNHATFFHVSTLPPETRDALLVEFDELDLPDNTYYGDGSPIEPATLEHLREVYRKTMVTFPWKRGDVLLIDNMLTVHARRPFGGPRRILVAMAEAFRSADLDMDQGR